MAGWFKGPGGTPVYMGDDGLVHVTDGAGKVATVKPSELTGGEYDREYRPATAAEIQQNRNGRRRTRRRKPTSMRARESRAPLMP